MSTNNIQYLQRAQIDTAKWDRCIHSAPNTLIYAYTSCLDNMAVKWDALVWGDYEIIMPLPWKRKYGIKYVYTPMFIQRLGIYGKNITEDITQQFCKQAAQHFSYIDLMTNMPLDAPYWQTIRRRNYILHLHEPYEKIRQQFSAECIRNINKAVNRHCRFQENIPIDQVIQMYRQAYGQFSPYYNDDIFRRLTNWAGESEQQERLLACGVIDNTDNTLLFSALIFQTNERLYYIAGAPTAAGRKARATYFFIDQLIRQNAGKPLVFDFEGSDIPDVAAFYKRFGPQEESYYHLQYNQLPWWLRWKSKGYPKYSSES